MKLTASDRIIKARVSMLLDVPFFASLLMRLRMVEDASVPTFCTDGVEIRFSPAFVGTLTDGEIRGVLAHEVCHVALGHLWRMGVRDARRWNVATDYAINEMLLQYIDEAKTGMSEAQLRNNATVGRWEMPKCGLFDPAMRGKSSEEIYHLLPEPPKDGASSVGEFKLPSGKDGKPADAARQQELENEWKVAVTAAATAERMKRQGKLPGCLERFVEAAIAPKVAWRDVLREFLRSPARDDYSFRRPNRRFAGGGILMPGLFSERLGRIVVVVDTSGSICDETLADFAAEVQGCLDETQPECIEVIYCDAEVNHVEEFTPGDIVKLKAKGGGGTDFRPAFDRVNEYDEPPVALVYLTDGWGTFPKDEPDYPVLWAAIDAKEAHFPWGRVVLVKGE